MQHDLYQQTTGTPLTIAKKIRMLLYLAQTHREKRMSTTGSSFKPFHESIISAIETAQTPGALRRLTCLAKHTVFPNEDGEPAKKIAAAIFRRAAQLKVSHRDEYFAKIQNRLKTGQLGTRPFHSALVDRIKTIPNDNRRDAHAQLSAISNLIAITRIPEGRMDIRDAFTKKAMRVGFCAAEPDLCQAVYDSLDSQRALDAKEAA